MSNKKETSIKDALGLGEVIHFTDGTQLPCVPACLADLGTAMDCWSKSLGMSLSVQACYHPMHKEVAQPAFEELLYIACGRKIDKDDLLKKINVANGAREVVAFIDRFLGFNQPDAGAEEAKG